MFACNGCARLRGCVPSRGVAVSNHNHPGRYAKSYGHSQQRGDCVSSVIQRRNAMRERVQSFGSFLAAMVIPNIGAFIAWGLITALFIPTGWIPNENFAKLVGPMITYLLPILIGYTGG